MVEVVLFRRLLLLLLLCLRPRSASPSRSAASSLVYLSSTRYPNGQPCSWGTDALLATRLAVAQHNAARPDAKLALEVFEAAGEASPSLLREVTASLRGGAVAVLGLAWSNVAQDVLDQCDLGGAAALGVSSAAAKVNLGGFTPLPSLVPSPAPPPLPPPPPPSTIFPPPCRRPRLASRAELLLRSEPEAASTPAVVASLSACSYRRRVRCSNGGAKTPPPSFPASAAAPSPSLPPARAWLLSASKWSSRLHAS